MEGEEEARTLSENEKFRKSQVVTELERVTLMEEISRRQKSRALWLKEGDRCTKFFHRVANSHRRNNAIDILLVDGAVSSHQTIIRNHIEQFYLHLLSEEHNWRPKVDGLTFFVIDQHSVGWLERPFIENAVHKVIRGMSSDKAQGPDGFTMGFFQACWEVIKEDLMQVFYDFHTNARFDKSLNSPFLALIPKKDGVYRH